MINTDKKITLRTVRSDCRDPWFNLALEAYLFDTIADNTVILYLWQNQNTVVIGKTQNAWKECHLSALEADGGKLARRPSGGGAVFHDLGNMCYTFIASSGLYCLERQLKVILEAVKALGIEAEFTGRNDITTKDGRKFSGNAFRFVKDTGLQHGTLLLDTDAGKMARYLHVSSAKMQAKGVQSVRSRVVNLITLNPAITPDSMSQALLSSFEQEYGVPLPQEVYGCAGPEQPLPEALTALYQKYASWEWRCGETPKFGLSTETRFNWGCCEFCFSAEKGVITTAAVYTDAMDPELADHLTHLLPGTKLDYQVLCNTVDTAAAASGDALGLTAAMAADIKNWLKEIL